MDAKDGKEIIRGAYNVTRKTLGVPNEDIEKKVKERMAICLECDAISENKKICSKKKGGCGCPLSMRTRSNKGCPKNKW